jgi:hypothetical protein
VARQVEVRLGDQYHKDSSRGGGGKDASSDEETSWATTLCQKPLGLHDMQPAIVALCKMVLDSVAL